MVNLIGALLERFLAVVLSFLYVRNTCFVEVTEVFTGYLLRVIPFKVCTISCNWCNYVFISERNRKTVSIICSLHSTLNRSV